MRVPLLCVLALLGCAAPLRAADLELKRYLYVSSPDGAQSEGKSGDGILVFDIDDGHRFVRRIDVPIFKEGLRGFCGNVTNHCVYYTTTNRRMGAYDLEQDKVLWDRTYLWGCDRACIPPDGRKLYVPTGWWLRGTNSGMLVIDARTGEQLKHIPVHHQAHNSIASLDGKYVFLGTETNFTAFRTQDESVVRNISGVGEAGVFPFCLDSRNRYAFICLGKHVGFDVVDLTTGAVPHRVFAGDQPIDHRTHGAGLTPDESELWISDQDGKKLFIFDATKMPPTPKDRVELSMGGHGWITFSLDGRFAWCHTPDVFDARTKQKIATLRDEHGSLVASSKFIEVHFRGGKVVAMGDQFGLGRRPAAR